MKVGGKPAAANEVVTDAGVSAESGGGKRQNNNLKPDGDPQMKKGRKCVITDPRDNIRGGNMTCACQFIVSRFK